MIELVFKCHDCGVFVSHWSNDTNVTQAGECPFCGSDSCIVYVDDVIPDDEGRWHNAEDLLIKIREALQYGLGEED